MPAKVFISCGQSVPEELKVARQVSEWLNKQGYRTCVALDAPTFAELNTQVISELKGFGIFSFYQFC